MPRKRQRNRSPERYRRGSLQDDQGTSCADEYVFSSYSMFYQMTAVTYHTTLLFIEKFDLVWQQLEIGSSYNFLLSYQLWSQQSSVV